MRKICFAALIFIAPFYCRADECAGTPLQTFPASPGAVAAEKLNGAGLSNLYKVSDRVYRGEQPQAKDLPALRALGIVTILNLRRFHHDDAQAAEHASLQLAQVRMLGARAHEADVLAALCLIKQARGPVLIHCKYGRDRTGFIVALYRMVFEGMPRQAAIDEMLKAGFRRWAYPAFMDYLKQVDIPALRDPLGIKLSAG